MNATYNVVVSKKAQTLAGILRIALGWIFLWAFFDKTFGLGFATEAGKSWIAGVSPTEGFLAFGVKGPFAGIFHAMAGSAVVDWLFMFGLFGIGISLLLGICMRLAVSSGSLLLLLMYLALLPPQHNPIIDEHLVYILLLQMLLNIEAGEYLGFGGLWGQTRLVQYHSWLR